MNSKEPPIIAVTMGDPAGVGPEVVAKALASEEVYRLCRPMVVGDAGVIEKAIGLVKAPMKVRAIHEVTELEGQAGVIDVLDLHNVHEVVPGVISAQYGGAAMEYIDKAARLAMAGEVKALATAPINKEATKLAGCGEMGHLEYLAKLTEAREYATMLVSGPLRTVHLTTHYSLKDACNHVTKSRILGKLKLTRESFRHWGVENPRIAVAGLNPHAGEGGLLGREEIEEIAPAVEEARKLGIDARGPYPADSVFNRAINREFDAVLAMYHDQGHIPIKVYSFERSVSVALGLPFVRTSVDHGTAFDIAWKGIAEAKSMLEAIKMAAALSTGQGLFET